MSKKVLVVDDEEDIRDLVKFCLKKQGYSVVLADNGTSAMDVFRSESPDLIITDINMPGGDDGWEFIRKLGLEEKEELPPIVVMTGYSNNEFKKSDAIDLFLQKPFSMDEFIDAVEGVMKK